MSTPIDFKPLTLLPPEDWQEDDITILTNRFIDKHSAANWSEMGCKKTTTGLWTIKNVIDHKIKHGELNNGHPAILIITTRSGKGTFYQFCPLIFEDYTILNIDTQALSVFRDGQLIKIPKLKELPESFGMPIIAITHYNVFSKSTHGQFEEHPITGEPIKNEDGGLIMKAPTQGDRIMKIRWDFVWPDEIHRMKDKDARWTVRIKRNAASDKHGSTGTGFINRPHEIWSPLNFMDKQTFSSFWAFYDRYCEIDDADGYSKVVGVKHGMKDEFRALVREFGPRRTLSEVMPHIKEPLFQELECELSPVQRKMYDQIRFDLYTLDKAGIPIYAANVLSLLQRLRAICVATPEVVEDYYDEKLDRRVQKIRLVEPSSKLDVVMETIDSLEWDEELKSPVVIFSNFVGPLTLLENRFANANRNALEMGFEPEYPYIWLKEEDSDELRYNKWANLFASGEYRIFMSTLQLGGESINLTKARHVIFLDRSWSPKDNMQGIGRIRRPGQEGQPIVININARDTTDQYIRDVVNLKQGWFQQIFGNYKPPRG